MKKLSYSLEIILTYLGLSLIFFLIVIFTRNLESGFIFSLIAFFITTIILIYANYKFSFETIVEANKVINHFNEAEFSYKALSHVNKECSSLSTNINILGLKYNQTEQTLKEKINENQNYSLQYNENMEAKKQLVAAISHEIKTPLAVIEASANAILDEIYTGEEAKQELKNIIAEANKTNQMLKEIVAIYKLESTKLAFETIEENLRLVIQEILTDLSSLQLKYNQTIKLVGDFDIEVKINKKQFVRALKNIILNAIIYSPMASLIEIKIDNTRNYPVLSINNYGTNIEVSDLNRLFEPFFRGDKSRQRQEDSGNGLGLYLVKEILDKHHFDFGIKNIENGVSFYVILQDFEKIVNKKATN